MRSTLADYAKEVLDRSMALAPRGHRERVLKYLLDRARGDNNMVAARNGEYRVLAEARPELERRGAVVFDVGANRGDWTVELCAGRTAPLEVYAFEPSAETFRCLAGRLASVRSGARLHPVHAALGSAPGRAVLNVYHSLAGTNSLVARESMAAAGASPEAEAVRLVDGDGFCAEHGVSELGFVKVDTEGYELEVIKGLRGMLSRSAVGVLQFEYGGTWIDARVLLRDAFELLEPLGYAFAKIHPDGLQLLDGYRPELETFQYANFLVVRKDWLGIFSRVR